MAVCPRRRTHQHAGLGQLGHRRLGHRGAGAEQYGGGIGNGDIPVQRLLAGIDHILDPAAVDQHPAVLQVIDIGALGMQDGLEVAGADIVHDAYS